MNLLHKFIETTLLAYPKFHLLGVIARHLPPTGRKCRYEPMTVQLRFAVSFCGEFYQSLSTLFLTKSLTSSPTIPSIRFILNALMHTAKTQKNANINVAFIFLLLLLQTETERAWQDARF